MHQRMRRARAEHQRLDHASNVRRPPPCACVRRTRAVSRARDPSTSTRLARRIRAGRGATGAHGQLPCVQAGPPENAPSPSRFPYTAYDGGSSTLRAPPGLPRPSQHHGSGNGLARGDPRRGGGAAAAVAASVEDPGRTSRRAKVADLGAGALVALERAGAAELSAARHHRGPGGVARGRVAAAPGPVGEAFSAEDARSLGASAAAAASGERGSRPARSAAAAAARRAPLVEAAEAALHGAQKAARVTRIAGSRPGGHPFLKSSAAELMQ
jgi:hypothetical protein